MTIEFPGSFFLIFLFPSAIGGTFLRHRHLVPAGNRTGRRREKERGLGTSRYCVDSAVQYLAPFARKVCPHRAGCASVAVLSRSYSKFFFFLSSMGAMRKCSGFVETAVSIREALSRSSISDFFFSLKSIVNGLSIASGKIAGFEAFLATPISRTIRDAPVLKGEGVTAGC